MLHSMDNYLKKKSLSEDEELGNFIANNLGDSC